MACPQCKHQLRIPAAPADAPPAAYACPRRKTRFMVSGKAANNRASPAPQPPSPAKEPTKPTPPAGKLYQAACPRCSQACRFTVPPTAGSAGPTKLTVKCVHCTKPFAIQV